MCSRQFRNLFLLVLYLLCFSKRTGVCHTSGFKKRERRVFSDRVFHQNHPQFKKQYFFTPDIKYRNWHLDDFEAERRRFWRQVVSMEACTYHTAHLGSYLTCCYRICHLKMWIVNFQKENWKKKAFPEVWTCF